MQTPLVKVSYMECEPGELMPVDRFHKLIDRLMTLELTKPLSTGQPYPNQLSNTNFETASILVNLGLGSFESVALLSFYVYKPPEGSPYNSSIVACRAGAAAITSVREVNFDEKHAAYDPRAAEKLNRLEELAIFYGPAAR